MDILKKQNGMSAIGWLLLIGLIIAVSFPAMKILPIYLKDMKIDTALKKVESELEAQVKSTTPENIKQNLLDRFNLQQMPEITADEITVTQSGDKYNVRIQHQYKERIIKDKHFILNVDRSIDVPITMHH